jgi:hypothetical protein
LLVLETDVFCESGTLDHGASIGIGVGPHPQDAFHKFCRGRHLTVLLVPNPVTASHASPCV